MRTHCGFALLLTFTACVDPAGQPTEPASSALGVVPATESAQWKRVANNTLPDARYGQAVAYDADRGVVVMFGGLTGDPSGTLTPQQDTWEWDPTLGAWKLRTTTGSSPDPRSGAAMAYDSTRKKFVLFGGRAGSGYDLQDTWEWDPTTGAWTDKTGSGTGPGARSQHGMIYDSKAGKVLLFGGGRSQIGGDAMAIGLAFADTWAYDGSAWTPLTTTAAPSARSDFGFAYSSSAGKAYLFGGMETLSANVSGSPKQDIWEWDSTAGTWTDRTIAGSKPSARFALGMAADSSKGVVVFGGFDISTGGSKNDVWYWSPSTGTWEGHDAPSGALWPSKRQWSSLIIGGSASHPFLIAGLINDSGIGYDAGVPMNSNGLSREIWELDPSATTWTNRSAPSDNPGMRYMHAMASDLVTGKVYVFGGMDTMGNFYDDLWEWNGDKWVQCTADVRPPARSGAAMTYDPTRKSLILFGGEPSSMYIDGMYSLLADTWEWNTGTRKWNQLKPAASPSGRSMHVMVTDTTRQKIILYGGSSPIYIVPPYPYGVDAGVAGASTVPAQYQVWEWDGTTTTWTDRSSASILSQPGTSYPLAMVYDEGRKKVALFDNLYYNGSYWEWDPGSGGWAQRSLTDTLNLASGTLAAYDSIRRRTVVTGMPGTSSMSSVPVSTYELESATPTWYLRTTSTAPNARGEGGMAFDNQRDVVVLYGGIDYMTGYPSDETWEYHVASWGNGTGCTAATAAQCASGNCVDGVCCESASCSGACKSCNVVGKAGTCVLASPGTQVAGSCSGDQACDATGTCRTSNGKTCASATECASGFCANGVCCDTACAGTCASCNQAGKTGTCSPFAAGTDPLKQCGQGTPPCQSTCDGAGACAYPSGSDCGVCGVCNYGSCIEQTYRYGASGVCINTSTSYGSSTGIVTYTGRTTGTLIGTATGTGSPVMSATGTSFITSTATLTLVTSSATGTGTALPTNSRTASSTGTSTTSSQTASATGTRTGTTASGTVSSTGTSTVSRTTTATDTGSGTGSASGSRTVTATASTPSGTGTASRTVTTTVSTPAGSGTGSAVGTTTVSTPSGTGTASGTHTAIGETRDAGVTDGGLAKLGHGGCSCDLGAGPAGGAGSVSLLGLLGMLLLWRRARQRPTR